MQIRMEVKYLAFIFDSSQTTQLSSVAVQLLVNKFKCLFSIALAERLLLIKAFNYGRK